LTLFDVPLKVKTQKMKWVKDKLEDDLTGKSSPGAEAFTEWFTKNYEGISAEQLLLPPAESGITAPVPVFAELRRIALMTVIAEKLRDQGVAMPFWMRDYEVKPVPFETTTPAMEIKREKTDGDVVRTARIFGGVELSPESKLVKTYGSGAEAAKAPPEIREEVNRAVKLADSLETAVTKATPVGSTPLAVFSVKDASDNHVYQGVSLPGAASLALNPARLSQVDMSVPIVGGRDIRLVRSFNSFFNPNGPWGKGWAMDLPRLEPAIRDGNKYYELLTPLNSLYARFSEIKAVPELQNAQLQVSDEKGPFYGLADAQPKFLSNTKTQLLLLKDGTCWHFTPHGDLVAIEDGPQITIYERGNRGQVTRIVALFDGVCVAQIELKYTDKGTLAKAVGSTFGRPSAQPMEVSYAYDLSEHLASVRTAEGAVGYAYQGPWVASVTWTDKAADAKPELLSSYEYNAHGQVTDEKRGTTPLHYAIAAAAGGGLETTVSNVADKAHPSSTSYDRQMRPTDAKDADGTHTVWTYPSAGGVQATLTTPDQRKVTVTEIPEKDGGHKRILQTDGLPEVTAKVDAGGHLTTFGEGGQTLLKQEWRTDGQMAQQLVGAQAASFTYSKGGLLSSVLIHPSLEQEHIKTWHETALDWRGLPTRVTDCTGLDVAVNYDAAGRLTSIVQKTAKGNEGYSIERDDAGRPLAVKSSWGQTSYAYAKDGLLQRVETTRDDHTASVELTHGLVRKIAGFDMGVTSFEYDNKDETLRSVTCANGLKLANDYDANRRLASVSLGAERRVKLEYDVDGRVVGYILEPLSP